MRCLEKHAADRFQRASELLPTLNSLLTPSAAPSPRPRCCSRVIGHGGGTQEDASGRVAVCSGWVRW
jgi:hypothetical protein